MLSSAEWKVSRRWGWSPSEVVMGTPKGWFDLARPRAWPTPLGLLPKAFIKERVLGLFVRRHRGPVGPLCSTLWYLGSLPGKHADCGSKVYTDTHPPFQRVNNVEMKEDF